MKKCIFHLPYEININWPSGSQIRPVNMLKAFKRLGYSVDIVMGKGSERKKQIKQIKNNISNGVKYDFLYSESSTMPTLLTEKHHFPTYPVLDFEFFKFCKCNNIKVGLFYRDIYWNFKEYNGEMKLYKRIVSKFFYLMDLIIYNKLVDVLYLPSQRMFNYLPIKYKGKVFELPPGMDMYELNKFTSNANLDKENLNIFYVGGIGNHYRMEKLFKVARDNENVKLNICCREKEWKLWKDQYKDYTNSRINIIHKSGSDLIPYFNEADLFSLFLSPSQYREFAMPVKLFEYLSHMKPIIASSGTAVGDFVSKHDVGWSIDYTEHDLNSLLNYIVKNKHIIKDKISNINSVISLNTWESRVTEVVNSLN